MEIKTKFNVGDKVWRIFSYDDEFWQVEKRVVAINCISIEYQKNSIFIEYIFLLPYNETSLEEDCFATKEEAQKECERRNGNKGTED